MINSPSLSLTSPLPTNGGQVKSGPEKTVGSMSFSNHMERAARTDDAARRRESRDTRASETVPHNDESNATQEIAAKRDQSEPVKTDDRQQDTTAKKDSSSDAAESNATPATTENGKELQSDGQQVAEPEVTAAEESEALELPAESEPAKTDLETSDQTVTDDTDALDTEEQDLKQADGKNNPVEEASLTPTTQDGTETLDTDSSQSLDNTESTVDDETVDVSDSEAKAELTPSDETSVNTEANTEAPLNSEQQAPLASQTEAEGLTKREAAALSNVTATPNKSSIDTAASISPDTGKEAQTNLRWVMDQLAPKGEKNTLAQTLANVSADAVIKPDSIGLMKETVVADAPLLAQEGVELMTSKKSLEQLMSSLGGQVNGGMSNQAMPLNSVAASQIVPPRAEGSAPQMTMQTPPNSAAWGAEMTTKVSWVAKEGFKTAHIHLDPPELGSLTVKVSMDQDSNTQVSFIASSAQAKDVLESQMQRLREMLQQQGVEVEKVDVEVSQGNDQSAGQGHLNAEGERGQGGLAGNGLDEGELDDSLENVTHIETSERSIDFYA